MMDREALAEMKGYESAGGYENPRYEELLIEHHDVDHLLRMPPDEWPDPLLRASKHLNTSVYIPMQGPSELGASSAPCPGELGPHVRPPAHRDADARHRSPARHDGSRAHRVDGDRTEEGAPPILSERKSSRPVRRSEGLFHGADLAHTGPGRR